MTRSASLRFTGFITLLGITSVLLLVSVGLWVESWLDVERLLHWQQQGLAWHAQNAHLTALFYFILFVGIAIIPMPVFRVAFALLGGAIFGLIPGIVMVAMASVAGASIAFLLGRHYVSDWCAQRSTHYRQLMQHVNQVVAHNGWLALISLRLFPLIPYSAVNLGCGLTRMPLWQFALGSAIGMLPIITLYVHAGGQLASLRSLEDLLNWRILATLALLATAPWLLRWVYKARVVSS